MKGRRQRAGGLGESAARMVAVCAVMTALLLAAQCALSLVAGVELVTAFLLVFCYVFGVKYGMITATAFSLLRNFIFGFAPDVIVLYLIYFNAFALLFGAMGKRRGHVAEYVCPALVLLLAAGTLALAIHELPVSPLMAARLEVMLWALFAVLVALFVGSVVLLFLGDRARIGREAAVLSALAAFSTVCFTLLSDVITPLFYGWSMDVAIGYFYTGFFAMVPQTLCAAVSVALLFYPLERAFSMALSPAQKKRREALFRARTARKRGGAEQIPPSNDGRTQKDMV